MNISSVVVRTRPETVSLLRGALAAVPGVEVHGASEDGRVAITVEERDGKSLGETLLAVQNLKGVLAASLVYNYNDSCMMGASYEKEGNHGTDQA